MIKFYLRSRINKLGQVIYLIRNVVFLQISLGYLLGIYLSVTYLLWSFGFFILALGVLVLRSRSLKFLLACVTGIFVGLNYLNLSPEIRPKANLGFQVLEVSSFGYQQIALVQRDGVRYQVEAPNYPKLQPLDSISIRIRDFEYIFDSLSSGGYLCPYTKGVLANISSGDISLIKKLKISSGKVLGSVRAGLLSIFTRKLGIEEASLASGLVLGDGVEGVSKEFQDEIRYSGLSHIVAVSGFNFGVIFLIVMKLKNKIPRTVAYGLAVFLMLCYYLLVGVTNLPATRALVFTLILTFLRLIGRKVDVVSVLILTLCVMVSLVPPSILDVSLQLSVAALLGIVFFYRPFLRLMKSAPDVFSDILSGTLAATLATFPITLPVFGGLSLVSILSNIIVVPLVSIAMFASLVLVPLAALPISDIWVWMVNTYLGFINFFIHLFGGLNFAYSESPVVIMVYCLFVMMLLVLGDYLVFYDSRKK